MQQIQSRRDPPAILQQSRRQRKQSSKVHATNEVNRFLRSSSAADRLFAALFCFFNIISRCLLCIARVLSMKCHEVGLEAVHRMARCLTSFAEFAIDFAPSLNHFAASEAPSFSCSCSLCRRPTIQHKTEKQRRSRVLAARLAYGPAKIVRCGFNMRQWPVTRLRIALLGSALYAEDQQYLCSFICSSTGRAKQD